MIIEENVFYKKENNIKILYPNVNDCDDPNYTFLTPKIEINGNYFATFNGAYAAAGSTTALDWTTNSPSPLPRDGYDKIEISKLPQYYYTYKWGIPGHLSGDEYIQIDEGTGSPTAGNNKCEPTPLTNGSYTPIAEISSSVTANGPTDVTPKVINAGQSVYFDVSRCADKNRATPPQNDMLYFYRFHDKAKTLESEFRTTNFNITNKIKRQFTLAGITNVTLMALDKTNIGTGKDWKASDLAKQLITVLPAQPTIGNNHYVSFWIKDTYVGRELIPHQYSGPGGPWPVNGVDDGRLPPPNGAETGFKKYLKINDDILWEDDIEGDEGWQYVGMYLGNNYMQGTIEIGIKADSYVNVQNVRGVTVYVDDVYMNCKDDNAILNGDFETYTENQSVHNTINYRPPNWVMITENNEPQLLPPFIAVPPCPPHAPQQQLPRFASPSLNNKWTWNAEDNWITTDEVRSGFLSCKMWIMGISPEKAEANVFYNAPFVYKSMSQDFDVRGCFPCLNCEEKSIQVFPNPVLPGKDVMVKMHGTADEQKIMDIYNANGSLVYNAKFDDASYTINKTLQPGSYVIKIKCHNNVHVQKLVVVN